MSLGSNGDRTQLTAEEIARQGAKTDHDEIQRQMLRGDETKGDPDERDHAGALEHEDTPHGREERKHEVESEANDNDRRQTRA